MLPEAALLCDVIRAVPNGSCWYISSDSWERIPAIFRSLLEITDGGEWLVKLTDETKETVLRKIVRHELAQKIVHLEISSPAGEVLFRSYDCMCGIDLNGMPEVEAELLNKYPSLTDSML